MLLVTSLMNICHILASLSESELTRMSNERIFLKRKNYWIEEDEHSDPEFRVLEFHPDAIKELHDALDIDVPTYDGALPGVELSGQINDFHLVDIDGKSVYIDWQLANLIKKLNDEGVETYGCDQGSVVPEGHCIEFDETTYDGSTMVTTRVTLESGEAKYGFISFNMEHENLVVELFKKCNLELAASE